jgi:hypothetical protein
MVNGEKWGDKFQKFWKTHGKILMHKMTGMRDPMLNLLCTDSGTFDELVETASPEKKK